jgi:hypothetical protein
VVKIKADLSASSRELLDFYRETVSKASKPLGFGFTASGSLPHASKVPFNSYT